MADGLKIYACSGVGAQRVSGQTPGAKVYDMEGTSTISNTQAMNSLLALMNVTKAELTIADGVEKRNLLEQLDVYSVCFYYAQLYRNDTATLREVGNILAEEVAAGVFSELESDSLEAHAARVDSIIEDTDEKLRDNNGAVTTSNKEFFAWYKENVIDLNKQGLSDAQIKGIGAAGQYGEITEYLSNAGTYFLYLYLTDEQVQSLPYSLRTIVSKRRRKQADVYNYVRKCYTSIFGSEQTLQNIIRTSIINEYGMTPENVVSGLYKVTPEDVQNAGKEVQPVGIATEIICAIILAVAATVVAIVLGAINACATVNVAKYQAPTNIDDGVVDQADLNEWSSIYAVKADSSKVILFGGLVAAAAYLWSKNKKKTTKKDKE